MELTEWLKDLYCIVQPKYNKKGEETKESKEIRGNEIKSKYNVIDLQDIFNILMEEDPLIGWHTVQESLYGHFYRGRCKYDERLGFYKRNLEKLKVGESPDSRALLDCHELNVYNFYGQGKGVFKEIDGSPKIVLDDRYAKRDIDQLKHHYKRRVDGQTKNANTLRVSKALQAYKEKQKIVVEKNEKAKEIIVEEK